VLSLAIPVMTLLFSIVTKSDFAPHVSDFYDVRVLILVSAIIPPIIFSSDEAPTMWSVLAIGLLITIFFDPIHDYFGVGYHDSGFDSNRYYIITIVTSLAFVFQVISVLALKRNVRLRDDEKEKILEQINEQNKSLIENNVAIEQQKKALEEAKGLIEAQSAELSKKNEELEFLVNEKTKNLIETNHELIRYNNELRQFSYTISHNLRAPVASLIGLTNIIDTKQLNDDNKLIIDHIQSSSKKLDNVFKDLNKIIDLRNSIGGVKEKIDLANEIHEVKNALKNEIETSKAKITTEFEVPIIYSIRPFINSILYNLISNAIKYRTKLKNPIIRISSKRENGKTHIVVADNGMGIDTDTYKEDIFKMYKRFHHHTEGKGLGLYLVKLQAESLGGTIGVTSKLGEGSEFHLFLPKSSNIEDQTVMETDFFRLFYDAHSNTTGMVWKRDVSDEEYREAFVKNLEVFRQFKTPNMVSSMHGIEPASPENQEWLLDSIIPDAIEYGLKKLAVVANSIRPKYREYLDSLMESVSPRVSCRYFKTMEDAKKWINEEEA
jgi:signal transduction histidine kinase